MRPQTPVGTPDLVLIRDAPSDAHVVVIENKLGANEGNDQTCRYAKDKCVAALVEDAEHVDLETASRSYLYLTLFPNQKPSSDTFEHATYEDLLDALEKADDGRLTRSGVAGQLLSDLRSLFTTFYDRGQIAPDNVVLERLKAHDGLDAGFLYFQRLFDSEQGIALPNGLDLRTFFRSKQQGRHYYGTQLSKPHWNPGGMDSDDGSSFNPDRDFHIHFEPQYDVLKNELKLALHYETAPYHTKKWMMTNVPTEQFERHERRKRLVRDALHQKDVPGLKYYNYYLQIAKAQIDFDGKILTEVKSEVEPVLTQATQAIDEVLENLD